MTAFGTPRRAGAAAAAGRRCAAARGAGRSSASSSGSRGWLGVALTGTDAGSNALFGNLQKVTAERLGLSPILMASANSAGGVMGKMIDAQSIVVAGAATQQVGNEAAIFRAVLKHSLALVAIVGLVVAAFAFLAPGWIPEASGP